MKYKEIKNMALLGLKYGNRLHNAHAKERCLILLLIWLGTERQKDKEDDYLAVLHKEIVAKTFNALPYVSIVYYKDSTDNAIRLMPNTDIWKYVVQNSYNNAVLDRFKTKEDAIQYCDSLRYMIRK